MENILIRQENPMDYKAVYQVVQKAFESAEHADGNEQDLVQALRKSDAFCKQLSLVAEKEGKIIGYILFTKVSVGSGEALALAPLAVLPQYQKQGVGTALIKRGHEIAKQLGYSHSIVLGSERYYPRFGYQPASQFGIQPPFDVPSENFMAISLGEKEGNLSGVVEYAKEFFEV